MSILSVQSAETHTTEEVDSESCTTKHTQSLLSDLSSCRDGLGHNVNRHLTAILTKEVAAKVAEEREVEDAPYLRL